MKDLKKIWSIKKVDAKLECQSRPVHRRSCRVTEHHDAEWERITNETRQKYYYYFNVQQI